MKIKHSFYLIPLVLLSFTTINQEIWKAPESAKTIKNPVATKKLKASAKKGAVTFKKFCIVCHGTKGIGNGPGGKALTPHPANLTSARVQNQVDGEIFWKISNGRGPMIKWDPIIKESDRWDLVNYIRTLKN
jgi:mono/diheme cytochrome c family protein